MWDERAYDKERQSEGRVQTEMFLHDHLLEWPVTHQTRCKVQSLSMPNQNLVYQTHGRMHQGIQII